jgi:GAF domain-containing protein
MAPPEREHTHGALSAEDLGDVMSRAARRLQREHGDVEATLQAITNLAITAVPRAEGCSISYVTGRTTVEPRASSSELPGRIDALQGEIGEGPCLDAVWEEEVVRVEDVAADPRWPRFAARASAMGVGSMLCFQLFVEGDHMGALNLYSRTTGAFDDESEGIARMLAAHAAVALAGAEHESDLRRGMDSRDVIGQAKGILMERHKLTADQAFGVLARASQDMNLKLVDVARTLSETGAVPGSGDRGS